MRRYGTALLMCALLGIPLRAGAEEACKMKTLKSPALKLADVYAMAEGYAKAWKKDAVPAQISNTSLGPLQPDGSSTAWNIQFYSEQSKSHVAISTFRGSLTCWADAGSAGRIPDLKPNFFRDGAKLYALAQQHGGALLKQGYFVMIGTAAAPSDRHATWNINFSKDQGKSGGLTILADGNTGALEKVLKD
jgi:hypothetical protein